MPAQMLVGMDVGSTTVKAVVVDAATDQILWSDYQRHETKQPEKTLEFLGRLEAELKIATDNCRVFITGSGGTNRFNPATGIIAPRNDFIGKPLHRVDMRLLRRFSFGGHASMDGILEVFNVFNHVNYGNYVTTLGAANFGAPVAQDNVAYKPRQLQLGFRATF